MTTITTTVVARFGDAAGGAGAVLKAEIDGREDGYNNGITTFRGGDEPAFLIIRGPGVTVDLIETSTGIVRAIVEEEQEPVEEELRFEGTREATLADPAVPGTLVLKWLGKDLGSAVLQADGVTVLSETSGVAVAKVTYQRAVDAYRVTNIEVPLNGESSFSVLIVVTGTAA